MYDYIKGYIEEITPTEVILECNGIGYKILISLNTYSELQKAKEVKIFMYHLVREDDEQLYGFATKDERSVFILLTSVSGIGPGTARMMLSSMTADEIRGAIIAEDVNKIKSIKGIGLKSAQRLIIELKDKIIKGSGAGSEIFSSGISKVGEEAKNALILLGFSKANVEKVVNSLIKSDPNLSLEQLIKFALKEL